MKAMKAKITFSLCRLAIGLVLLLLSTRVGFSQEGTSSDLIRNLYPRLKPASQNLMKGYLNSLQSEAAMQSLSGAMAQRRKWHRQGHLYTPLLLESLDKERGEARQVVIDLLGGTHDDRAAVRLKEMLRNDLNDEVRIEIYAALAELGYYTRYHSGLLLQKVQEARLARNGKTHTQAALALATIQNTEASWAQDQLYELKLIDGGLSEQIGPLLKLRDYALKSGRYQ